MKTIQYLACIFILLAFTADQVRSYVGCPATPKDEPAPVDTETMTDFVINFDSLPEGVLAGPINMSVNSLTVTLQGVLCKVASYYGLGTGTWDRNKVWYPDTETGSPQMFLGLGDPQQNSYCELVFSEPITAFSIRVASFVSAEAAVFAYDDADQQLNCENFPFTTAANANAYSVKGFNSSLTNNIKRIVIQNNYAVADLVRGTFCTGGKSLRNGRCLFPDPCLKEPYPCDPQASCSDDFSGVPLCECHPFYDGVGTLDSPCSPINCSSARAAIYCNEHSSCTEKEGLPFINCTCNAGYTGNGVGGEGCVAILPPSAAPVTVDTPNNNAPTTAGPVVPNKKVSVGSSLVQGFAVVVMCSIAFLI